MKEYIKFSKIVDKNNKKYGYTKESIIKTIDECIAKNILSEYLSEYKKEVYNIMTYSIDHQKLATEMYGREQYAEGKVEGMLCILVEMVKDKILSVAEAAKRLGVSESDFIKMSKV